MRCVPVWIDRVHDINKAEQCIHSLCFNPDGSQLLVAAGQIVLVYDCCNGNVLQSLTGHKDNVYCVDYSKDGKRFASGGADKVVIIWTSKLEAILKYTHNEAIQSVSFNPITYTLASCAVTDFSFWSSDQKSVQKYKTISRIHSSAWSIDGQFLALGLANGTVSIRNAYGDEKYIIERPGGTDSPIWALAFSPVKDEADILCVTDWNQKIAFYSIDGKIIGKERSLGFEPLSVNYTSKGEYILIAGCNKQCVLYNQEGIRLSTIGEEHQSWIWSCVSHPNKPFVVTGCQDGTISYLQLVFSTVHGLYQERYAFRQNMTDVIVQHLLTNDKVRLKCRDWVKKIAIYKHRLAVLLPTRVVIYELDKEEHGKMHYRIKQKLNKSLDCNLLVVCADHIILCQETRLQCFTFNGVLVRQWLMDSIIRYIKVVGGPANNEGLIIGLADGQISKIYIGNPFPVNLMKLSCGILCLDLCISRKRLAVVNEENRCIVYDLFSNQTTIQEMKGSSVCWNYLYDDMLCYSGNDLLNIKIANFPPYQQKFIGYVIGCYGSKVFSLNGSAIISVEIPLSSPMYQCLEKQSFRDAYGVACLGVTEGDWKTLAHAALEGFYLEIATKSFSRIRDLQYLELIHDFQEKNEDKNKEMFLADVFAYEGKFKEAGKLYKKCGQEQKALQMFTELRMFDLAQDFLDVENIVDKKSLIQKKSEWAHNSNDPKAVAEMYLSMGDVGKAIDIAIQNGWIDMLLELSKKVDKNDSETLKKIAQCLSSLGEVHSASEIFHKLGEEENILQLHIAMKNWGAAFSILENHPEYEQMVYVPYADWLYENDKFVEAQKAYYKAGNFEQSSVIISHLIENAINSNMFTDAGYFHWLVSQQYLEMASKAEQEKMNLLSKFEYHDKYASIYYAYHGIHKYLEEPFTSYQPEALFNISRFLMNETKKARPKGVTHFSILYSLAKQARNLGAHKLARQALDHIQTICIPSQFQDFVDLASIMVRAKPYHDNEELLIMCYRCSTYNPLSTIANSVFGNFCVNCRQQFVHSFVTFEVLPLIEFQLEEGISDDEAIMLIQSTIEEDEKESHAQLLDSDVQSMLIEDPSQNITDPFTATLINLESDSERFHPIIINRETLVAMKPNTVIVCKWPKPLRYKYYRNLVPELQVITCSSCLKIFHIDDYEMEVLQKGHCPFCRTPPIDHLQNSSLINDPLNDEDGF